MSVQVDDNGRYHWKLQNYVFDVAAGKYVLQHRCNIAALDSLTNPVRSKKQYHVEEMMNRVTMANPDQKRRGETLTRSRSIQRANRFVSNSKANNKTNINWLQTKPKPKPTRTVTTDRDHDQQREQQHLNVVIPANTGYVTLSQYAVSLIVSNWYRTYYQRSTKRSLAFRAKLRVNQFVVSALESFTVQRFEFDEHHPLVQTWINYNIPMDEEPLQSAYASTPVLAGNEQEEEEDDDDEEESLSISHDSLSLPATSMSHSLFSSSQASMPSLSTSISRSRSNSKRSQRKAASVTAKEGSVKHHNNWECSASLGSIKWSTIFLGNVLHSQLLQQHVYVCNVSVDKLGYGLGVAFCGYNRGANANRNDLFYHPSKLSKHIQDRYNGYADCMKDCFVLYDDGEFCDWSMRDDANKGNVNQLVQEPGNHGNVRLISKLSRYALKTSKAKQLTLSPASSVNDEKSEQESGLKTPASSNMNAKPAQKTAAMRAKSKKAFFANARRQKQKQKRAAVAGAVKSEVDEFESESRSNTKTKRVLQGKSNGNATLAATTSKRAKAKSSRRMSEKFSFDENDVIQIAVDLRQQRITVHNVNNHKCVELTGFDYECIRIAFVLRFSTVTVLDQKWM